MKSNTANAEENALDGYLRSAQTACMKPIRVPHGASLLHPDSVVDVSNDTASRYNGLLDLVNDPFFLGKASALDAGIIVKLKELEVFVSKRRAELEQVLGLDFHSLQQSVQVGPLSSCLVNRPISAPSKIVE